MTEIFYGFFFHLSTEPVNILALSTLFCGLSRRGRFPGVSPLCTAMDETVLYQGKGRARKFETFGSGLILAGPPLRPA